MSSKFSTNVEGKIHEIRLDAKKGYQALFEVISNSIYSKNKELRKEKNANFQTMIPRELFEEINAFLTEKGMTKVDFIKKAFDAMQNNR